MVLELFVHPKERIQIHHVVYFLDFRDITGLGEIVGHIKDFTLAIIKHRSSKEKRKQEIEKGKIEIEKEKLEIEKGKIEILHLKADYGIKMVQLTEKRGYDPPELKGPLHLYYDQPDASTHSQPGMMHKYQGNYDEAIDLYQQSLKIEQKLGGRSGIAITLHDLAAIHQYQGNYEQGVDMYQQILEIQRELGDKSGIASTLGQLGRLHEEQDADYPAALEKYHQARLIFKELHSPDAVIAENDIARLKETMGEEAFSEAMEDIMGKYGS